MEDSAKTSNGLHRAVLIMVCVAAVLLVVYFALEMAYSGHVPFALEKCTVGFGLVGLVLCALFEAVYGLYLCFVRIGKWAKADLWGHYVPMLAGVLLVAGMIVAGFAVWAKWKYPSLQSRGVFGDSFGALNAMFSTCAFLVLLVSLAMQRRQMLDERLRVEKDQEDKRRERWPAVVIPEMKGRMFVLGMTGDNKLVVMWDLSFQAKNISRVHVLNVSARILLEQFSDDGLYADVKTELTPCIEKDDAFLFSVVCTEKIKNVDHMISVFSTGIGRRLEVKIGMSTAQRFYYSVRESFVLSAKEAQEAHRRLLAVKSWMLGEESRRLSLSSSARAQVKFTAYPKWNDVIQFRFEVLPSSYLLTEIGQSEFDEFTGNSKKTYLS